MKQATKKTDSPVAAQPAMAKAPAPAPKKAAAKKKKK
jgi:hypothetical protein